jgi:hypothetical protein
MLKPKAVVLVQDDLPDFWYILRKRKGTIEKFIEANNIKDVATLNTWIQANKDVYLITEAFINEVSSHFVEIPNVVEEISAPESVKVKEEPNLTERTRSVDDDIPTSWEEESSETVEPMPEEKQSIYFF